MSHCLHAELVQQEPGTDQQRFGSDVRVGTDRFGQRPSPTLTVGRRRLVRLRLGMEQRPPQLVNRCTSRCARESASVKTKTGLFEIHAATGIGQNGQLPGLARFTTLHDDPGQFDVESASIDTARVLPIL